MEPKGPLPQSQPATCPYHEPDHSTPYFLCHLLKIHFYIILLSTPRSSKGPLFLSL